jgi:electron transport complex protein RnfC
MLFSPFRGGVHPDGFKELSSDRPISKLPIPEQLRVPLRQHAGSDATAIVKAGDRVLKGQLIASAGSGLSAPVHAPSSGIIRAVEAVIAAHPSGMNCNAVIIDCDGDDRPEEPSPIAHPFSQSPQQLSDIIASAGIVGMGGASFPAAVKLNSAANRQIDTVLINGGECEPYLTADDLLMCERADTVVLGARLIRYVVSAKKISIIIEDNKPKALTAMRQASNGFDYIDVVEVPTRYPMGSAKQMIQAATGCEVPAGGRSSDVGVLMHNVATAYAIAEAIVANKPLTSRIVTVSGGAIVQPQNVEAPIGTPIQALINHCGGTHETPARLLLGGPMMGHIVYSDQVPLIKGVGGVLALQKQEVSQRTPSPCIRCGRCVSACPMGLIPLEMANHAKQQDFEGANDYGLKDCILCGSCAYVCPSHIPLVHYFQYAKGQISAQRSKQKQTDLTRELSAARRLRIEKEAAKKAAAKAAKRRKSAATTTSSK